MLHGIYSSALAMESAARQQEHIAHNLAHANMPGFRRIQLQHGTFDDTLTETREQLGARSNQGLRGLDSAIDWQPGITKQTGRTLDIAISGPGFFEIETPQGPLYTRNGSFEINDRGELVTHDGYPVQGAGGPIQLNADASSQSLSISQDGTVSLGTQQLGQLKVVDFEDKRQLTAVGATLFQAPQDTRPTTLDTRVQSGFLEQSNVQPVRELVDMIATQRRHEAAARSLQTIMRSIEKQTNQQGGN